MRGYNNTTSTSGPRLEAEGNDGGLKLTIALHQVQVDNLNAKRGQSQVQLATLGFGQTT